MLHLAGGSDLWNTMRLHYYSLYFLNSNRWVKCYADLTNQWTPIPMPSTVECQSKTSIIQFYTTEPGFNDNNQVFLEICEVEIYGMFVKKMSVGLMSWMCSTVYFSRNTFQVVKWISTEKTALTVTPSVQSATWQKAVCHAKESLPEANVIYVNRDTWELTAVGLLCIVFYNNTDSQLHQLLNAFSYMFCTLI